MKFAVVLPSFAYNPQREAWARQAFASLAKSSQPSKRVFLFIVEHPTSSIKVADVFPSSTKFETEIVQQPDTIGGTEQTLAWGTAQVLLQPDVSHVVWMGDDALFNSHWLTQLEGLVNRHQNAKGWSVYRSAHVRYHAPLEFSGPDVLVRSLCGHGMTFTRWEWAEWGIDWRGPVGMRWPSPSGGNTLDLRHVCDRPGERWCTKQSYVQHTGTAGVNVTPGVPEYALEFIGE